MYYIFSVNSLLQLLQLYRVILNECDFFHRLVILLLVILLFNVIVDINIGVLAYLTQFINT
jgi:hypothetical protein